MPARLTLHLPHRPARLVWLRDDVDYTVGRETDSTICISDERVSRRQAQFHHSELGWELSDLGSKNGTLVDGARTQQTLLGDRCWISFSGVLMAFEHVTAERQRQETAADLERWRSTFSERRRIAAAGSLEGLLGGLLDSIQQLCGAERAFILLQREDSEFEVVAAVGLTVADLLAPAFAASVKLVARVMRTGGVLATSEAQNPTARTSRSGHTAVPPCAMVCLPLEALERQLGTVYADNCQPGSAFTELDAEILEALASQAALAISALRLDRSVRRLLTELPGQFDLPDSARDHLQGEIERAWKEVGGRDEALEGRGEGPTVATADPLARWSQLVALHGGEGPHS